MTELLPRLFVKNHTNVKDPGVRTAYGKLAGAVTHVLISDPETGYGILIEDMLEAAG